MTNIKTKLHKYSWERYALLPNSASFIGIIDKKTIEKKEIKEF